ncbi:MAG: iron ABC transporter permease [Acidimicrobiia bacterium]|nr:iron ABC transporter permease [Acidimicrobiia bacterium]
MTSQGDTPVGTLLQPPRAARRLRRGRPSRWLWLAAAAILAPALVPFGMLLARTLANAGRAVGIAVSARTLELVVNSAILVLSVSASAAAIGIGAAWLTERTDIPFRRLWRVIAALPLVIPSYVIALALISAGGASGIVADLVGLQLPVLRGWPGAWVALTISTYPFVYLTVSVTLRRIDPSHEEAARGLGASPARVFRTVVLPQLRPSAGAGVLLAALYTLSDFGAVSLMQFDVFTRVVYAQYAGRLDRVPAAVLATLLVLFAVGVLLVEQRTRGRAAYHSPTPSRPATRAAIGPRSTTVALGSLGFLAFVSLVLPLGTLVAWVVRGSATGPAPTIDWGATAGSISGSFLAALVAVAASIPVAMLVTRHPSRASAWTERISYAVFALPHITVALGMVFFASRFLGGLYQSLTLMVLVYASIFFAQALGSTRAALIRVDPSLEEASRSLGRGHLRTLAGVTIPLIWRGLLAGGMLVFLTTMKELPATLLLRPTGFDTLAVRIWSAAGDLLYARAAAPALILVVVSAVPMYLLATRDPT